LVAVRVGIPVERVRYLLTVTEKELRKLSQEEGELMVEQLGRVQAAASGVADAVRTHLRGDN
jgi:hypothetical protein